MVNEDRSSEVLEKYRQEKLNASILYRIQRLLHQFEADTKADRRLAWLGVALLIGILAAGFYLFGTGSDVTISSWTS